MEVVEVKGEALLPADTNWPAAVVVGLFTNVDASWVAYRNAADGNEDTLVGMLTRLLGVGVIECPVLLELRLT